MRNLRIHQKEEIELPVLGILTHITELSRYNYIYIKHMLKCGDKLEIKKDFHRSWDNASLAVYYKGFKIGYIGQTINKVINKHIDQKKEIETRVQHLPCGFNRTMKSLDILIKVL